MTEDQTERLIGSIDKLGEKLISATQHYTITGADDWQLLLALSGIFAVLLALIFVIIRMMWVDLKSTVKEQKTDHTAVVAQLRKERKDDVDQIWDETRRLDSKIDKNDDEVNAKIDRCKERCAVTKG